MELERETVLAESIEQTLEHRSENFVRIMQKKLKRKQRHPELLIDVYREANIEFEELKKQLQLMENLPKTQTVQSTLNSNEALEPPQPQPRPIQKLFEDGKKTYTRGFWGR
jgi:hypothetical protein